MNTKLPKIFKMILIFTAIFASLFKLLAYEKLEIVVPIFAPNIKKIALVKVMIFA